MTEPKIESSIGC